MKSFYEGNGDCMGIGKRDTLWFSVKIDWKQGCVVSLWLVNFWTVREVNTIMIEGGVLLKVGC